MKRPLLQLKEHRCFYCRNVVERGAHVDHFVPWSRQPNNAIDNLVVAHEGCNLAKSDHLVAVRHLQRWKEHRDGRLAPLDRIASEHGWECQGSESRATTHRLSTEPARAPRS